MLFVDDLHELRRAATTRRSAEIKLALARGELRLVGAATTEEYRRTSRPIRRSRGASPPIEIEEPDEESAFLLLRGSPPRSASTTASALRATRPSPRPSLVDPLPARPRPPGQGALHPRPRRRPRAAQAAPEPTPSAPSVAAVVAEIADVPVERLLETDRERLLGLEKVLAERVVGHGAALARIARVVRRNAAGLRARRPIGSFLLLGPTGVGKTETAKALAEAPLPLPRRHDPPRLLGVRRGPRVARLIGAPPGYIGHEAGGQLTEAVRRRPYQVILLDEIEKAHRDVLEAFLQVFDEGRLTDGRGRRVDFTNAVIVMTSNLGAAEMRRPRDPQRRLLARRRRRGRPPPSASPRP